jgi:hypothetical protein
MREHIESLVFKNISTHTKSLWPVFSGDRAVYEDVDEDNKTSDLLAAGGETPGGGKTKGSDKFIDIDLNVVGTASTGGGISPGGMDTVTELSGEHSLHMKLSYLRFITIENLGLTLSPAHKKGDVESVHPANNADSTVEISPVSQCESQNYSLNNYLCAKEEWYLAMKGLCRAMQFETPGEIMFRLVATAKLISHALNAQLNHKSQSDVNLSCSGCGKVHVSSENDDGSTNEVTASSVELQSLTVSTCLVCTPHPGRHNDGRDSDVSESASIDSNLAPESEKLTVDTVRDSRLDGASSGAAEYREISADDLMPAITWVIIQVGFLFDCFD